MISVFANFKINSSYRLNCLKNSLLSFNDRRIVNWVINIKGKYKLEASRFLKENIKSPINISYLESKKGWMYDSKEIAIKLKGKYIFFWIEDHICLKNKKNYFFNCIKSLNENNIDQMLYSFWHNGNYLRGLKNVNYKKNKYLTFYTINNRNLSIIQNNRKKLNLDRIGFLINATSIFKKKFFLKILSTRKPFLRRYNKMLPFDFEKRINDDYWFPIKHAVPNKEIFASVDDDHGEKGYSLISRGIYKAKNLRKEEIKIREKEFEIKNFLFRNNYFISKFKKLINQI